MSKLKSTDTNLQKYQRIVHEDSFDERMVINPTSVATMDSCRKLGINFAEAQLNSDKMAALAAYSYEHLGFDSVMPYFSVLQEAAALGCDVDWGTGNCMPKLRKGVYSHIEECKIPEDFLDRQPIKTVLEAIRALRKKLGEKVLIIGKVMGPWTLSYHLHGVEDFLVETLIEPEIATAYLNSFKEITKIFAEAQFEAGADVITLADHATSDLVSPDTYQKLLLPLHKEILSDFKGKDFILHCCGNTNDRIHLFAEAGFKVFHLDSKNDIKKALDSAGKMKLTGCVNNPDILLRGTLEDIEKQVLEILAFGIRLISPECAIPLQVNNNSLYQISKIVKEGSIS